MWFLFPPDLFCLREDILLKNDCNAKKKNNNNKLIELAYASTQNSNHFRAKVFAELQLPP